MKAGMLWVEVLLCMFFGVGIALAQVTTATISGTVSDSTGAVVPGAVVTVRNVETGITRTVSTDSAGRYRAPRLGMGDYAVTAESAGFQTSVRSGITLTVGRAAVVDFALQIGAVAETITVTGEAPLIETTTGTVGSLVNERAMRDLPLNGRSFDDLTGLQPGVVSNVVTLASGFNGVYTGSASRRSINGAKAQQSLYLLDGLETTTPSEGMPVASVLGQQLGVAAIREFTLLQNNFGAQYGRSVGGLVNAVTQSGTNNWHGSAFWFLRNEKLDARNFFNIDSQSKPPLKQNQFGATFGGPIQEDKTFFFAAYEAIRKRDGKFTINFVPTAETRKGMITNADHSINRTVEVSPYAQPFLDLFPLPNGPYRGGGLADFFFTSISPQQEDYGTVRLDQQFGENDSLFGRLTVDRSSRTDPTPLRLPQGDYFGTSTGAYWIAAISETHIFSPTVLNTARFGFTRRNDNLYWPISLRGDRFDDCAGLDRALRFVTGTCMPWTLGGGLNLYGDIGPSLSGPAFFIDNTLDFSDTININKGSHSITTGGEVKRYLMEESNEPWVYGQLIYTSIDNVLKANPLFITMLVGSTVPGSQIADVNRNWRQTYSSFFFQDDWQVRPGLTLNLGLRWESITGPTEIDGKLGQIKDLLRESEITPLGKGNPLFEIRDGLKGFSPRFGFAWTPFGDQKTVLRGGLGAFKEMPLEYVYQLALNVPPYSERFQIFFPEIPFTFEEGNTTEPLLVPFDFKIPYILQYNLSLERQVTDTLVVKANYVGTRSINQLGVYNPNQAPPVDIGGRWVLPKESVVPNPNLTSIRLIAPITDGWYNAAQVVVEKRFSKGLQFNASYTFSRNIDMNSTGTKCAELSRGSAFTVWNAYDIDAEKSLSSLHIKHNAIFSYIYEFPSVSRSSGVVNALLNGWAIRGTNTFRTGLPVNISMSPRISGNRQQSNPERPDLIPGGNNNPIIDNFTPEQYFDTSQFTIPQNPDPDKYAGVFGNVGRNTLIGPGLANWDLSFSKDNSIGEGKNLEVRAEFFNIMNHPNFAPPSSFGTGTTVFLDAQGRVNPNAGRIVGTTTTSRQIQFGLKFIF